MSNAKLDAVRYPFTGIDCPSGFQRIGTGLRSESDGSTYQVYTCVKTDKPLVKDEIIVSINPSSKIPDSQPPTNPVPVIPEKQSRVTILGYNNARSEYGTVATTSSIRSKLLSTLRKNISLLTRGRTTFSDVPYLVVS